MNKRVTKIGWIVLAALLTLSLILVPGCTAPAEQEEEEEEEEPGIEIPFKNPDTFVQMIIGEPDTLDPAWCYETAGGEQIQYMYEPLLYYDGTSTSEFIPVLATEWEFNEAELTYTFKIREGVKFHEGGDLTPEDVEYSFERWMVQDRAAGPTWMIYGALLDVGGSADVTFADIDAAVEVDGDSVVFKLAGPYWQIPFLQILCGQWASIVDKEWCIANGGWDGTEETWMDYNQPADEGDTILFDQVNGTGRWKLDIWEKGSQIKLVKFDDYWGDPAPFDHVITQLVEEWTTRKLALLNGDADYVNVPRAYIGELEGIDDLTVYKDLPQLALDAFFFNMCISEESAYIGSGQLDGEGIPPDFFSDVDVRRGFAYAFDYETFLKDALQNEAQFVGSPVVEGLYGYNPDASRFTYDLDKAAEHLQAAWGGELWDVGCKFTLLYNAGNLARKTMCEVMAEGLLAVNDKFRVSIQPISWGSYVDHLYDFSLPMFSIGWLADYPHADNFVSPFMHSGAPGVFSHFQCYGSAELDAKIVAAFQETDPVQQQALYDEIQEIYFQDPGGIVLVQPLARRYFTKYIKGFYFNTIIPGNAGPLWDMSKSES
ncbi:MAG: ABC transporter substrate-binding protein [Dehalococcoidia bacterium]